MNDQTLDTNESNLQNCKKIKKIKVEELKINELIETKSNNDGQYSLLLQKELSGCQIFIFGLLGSGKSALMNYYKFRDINVIQKGLRYVVEVDDDLKEKLKGESLIVHTNFVVYVGGINETLKNEEQKLLLNEIHLNLEQNIIDHEFLECFGDLKSLDQKYFQILITGYEMEHRHFEFYLLMYVRAI